MGVKNVEKNDPPFFGSKIMNLLVFFRFGAEKVFPGRDSMGFVWGGVGRVQLMHFSAIFATLAVLAISVTQWYPIRGV